MTGNLNSVMFDLWKNWFHLFYADGHEVQILDSGDNVVDSKTFTDCNDDEEVAAWARFFLNENEM